MKAGILMTGLLQHRAQVCFRDDAIERLESEARTVSTRLVHHSLKEAEE